MDELKTRILTEGKILPGNIIKVGSFLNHQVDTALMGRMADEFAKHFDISRITKILTIEASGIALATVCSFKW
ncbi:MAG: xanthine phosphoribosyltransferase, partial [Spirochaetales bacterium]|nr:xanthine phosphoribosyltransferase [Spirochaetales bacterium]